MGQYKNLDGIGDDVDEEQVGEALDIMRRMMSLMEVDRDEMYDVVRVLEVLYDEEPDPPTDEEFITVFEVISNVESKDVKSLEPAFVEQKMAQAHSQIHKADSARSVSNNDD